jgi:hypothetical protein
MNLARLNRRRRVLFRSLAGIIAVVAPIVLLVVDRLPGVAPDLHRIAAWACALMGTMFVVASLGYESNGRFWGVLIDERKRFSLSRLQMALWTVLILSTLYVIFVGNAVRGSADDVLNVEIGFNLIALMGFSITSYIVAPIASKSKSEQSASEAELARKGTDLTQLQGLSVPPSKVGTLIVKGSDSDARIGDLIRGEEIGNATEIDLPRFQMLLITVVVVIGYGIAVGIEMASANATLIKLPDIQQTIMLLVLVSHGGYLAGKVAPTSATSDGLTSQALAKLFALSYRSSEVITRLRKSVERLPAAEPKRAILESTLGLAQALASDIARLSSEAGSRTVSADDIGVISGRLDAMDQVERMLSSVPQAIDAPAVDTVLIVQRKLRALGFQVREDGIPDAATEKAISEWLARAGVQRDGLHPSRIRFFEELAHLI